MNGALVVVGAITGANAVGGHLLGLLRRLDNSHPPT